MSVMHPLKWHYPFIPFINEKNEDVIHSPIPILGCVHEKAKFDEKTGNPSSEFFSNWTRDSNLSTVMHFDLLKNLKFGKQKVDLKQFLSEKAYYKELKSLRTQIAQSHQADYILRHIYEPKHGAFVKLLSEYVDILRKIVHDIYLEHLPADLGVSVPVSKDSQFDFSGVKEHVLARTGFDKTQHADLLSSQAFQMHLERLAATH